MEINQFIRGSCEQMCPSAEVSMRTKERILHFFEQNPPPSPESRSLSHIVCITEFARSAAGTRSPQASDLRTPKALRRTIEYLLQRILPDTRKPFWFVYEFIFDRMRCVRQEIVIQNLNMSHTIGLLEPIAMFLAYSSYRLCETPIGHYDPYVCNQHLQECVKKLLCCYDAVQRDNRWPRAVLANQNTLEALYVTLNLGSIEAIARSIALSNAIKVEHDGLLQKSIELSQLYHAGHFYRVLHQMHRLPPIIAGVVALRAQTMRRQLLISFSTAYHSKTMNVPLDWLSQVLVYHRSAQLVADLQHYKCAVSNDRLYVTFNKTSIDRNAPEIKPRHEAIIDQRFDDDKTLLEMFLL